jgi:hypothetical protein
MESCSGFAGQRARIQMQTSFRGQFAHGQPPTLWPDPHIRFPFQHAPLRMSGSKDHLHRVPAEYRSHGEARRNAKKRYRYSLGVKRERKLLHNRTEQEFYSFEFSRSGTGSAGIPDTRLIHVLLIAALLLEFADKVDGFVGRARAMLGDDIDQRALNVLCHSLGIAADVDVSAFR